MMGRKYKGTFGYLKKRRIRSLIRSAFELAAVLAIYFTAWAILKDNKNVFTIMAALLCIPTGKSIVDTIMCFLATGCSDDAHARIEEVLAAAPGTFPASYDLYLTGYQKNFALSHAAVADGAVCALTDRIGQVRRRGRAEAHQDRARQRRRDRIHGQDLPRHGQIY